VRPGELVKLIKFSYLVESRTCVLVTCSIVPKDEITFLKNVTNIIVYKTVYQ
jgi:hypothetical protein